MRYFKFAFLLCAVAIFAPIPSSARGVPPDFAASAKPRVNYYRAMAKLPPIVDDAAISAGALNHARYLVKNGIAGGDIKLDNGQLHFQTPQDAFRWEVKGKPFYSDEGASSGRYAVIMTAHEIELSGAEFVDRLMTMPFSGLIPMVPQFSVAGLGAYCDPDQCAIVIPYRFALEKSVRIALYDGPASDRMWNPHLGLIPAEKGRLIKPVEFPARRCRCEPAILRRPGLSRSLGRMPRLPGTDWRTDFDSVRRRLRTGRHPGSVIAFGHADGVPIDTCLITADSYRGRTEDETTAVKSGLNQIGAAVILPREPLAPGHYNVAVTEAGKVYQWGFTVAGQHSQTQSAAR